MKENNKPLLSICIPTYNRERLLEENLNKIVSQLKTIELINSVEIVISDNDSKDGTQKLVNKFLNKYNIKYIKNDYNIGGLANIMKVAEYPSGEYLWLLADDDCVTDFSLGYLLEIIKREKFDVMFCNSISSENMDVKVNFKENKYNVFNGISSYVSFLKNNYKGYKNLISFFSFYSILISKTEYFKKGMMDLSDKFKGNDFPQDMVIYQDLSNKKIIIPDNIFVIGRLLNEGYVGSTKLVRTFNECMDFIEKQYKLENNSDWKYIKKVCEKGWRKNMILNLITSKLHIDYKHNKFFKKIYWLYKKYIQ